MSEQNTGASRPWPECQDFDAHQLLRLAITEDTARAEMFRRIAGKLEACQWRPIATAPRDGTLLDLWFAGDWDCRVADACWRGEFGWWVERRGCSYNHNPTIITHWRPIPEAPSAGTLTGDP